MFSCGQKDITAPNIQQHTTLWTDEHWTALQWQLWCLSWSGQFDDDNDDYYGPWKVMPMPRNECGQLRRMIIWHRRSIPQWGDEGWYLLQGLIQGGATTEIELIGTRSHWMMVSVVVTMMMRWTWYCGYAFAIFTVTTTPATWGKNAGSQIIPWQLSIWSREGGGGKNSNCSKCCCRQIFSC